MVLRVGKFHGLTACTVLTAAFCATPGIAADVLTYHNDVARTGQNLSEIILTPSNVNATNFGRLATLAVDGRVDAQPLYVSGQVMADAQPHNLLIVATENDSVYAFDADSGAGLWQVSLLGSGETASDDRSCGQVSPEIGVTGTPVIDLSSGPNGTIYVVAMSKNGTPTYFQRLHALNLKTGAEQFGGPVNIQATYPGTGENSSGSNVVFDPKQYKARPGLLLLNGVVFIGWSSHCDIQPYTAWLMGYNKSSLAQVSVLNLTPNGAEGSIWQAGAGPAADAQGNIYFLMANGTFDTTLTGAGFPAQGDYGNAFMKVATGGMSVTDYFTMDNTVSESNADEDLGSGGAMVLPDMVDANGVTRHLAVGAGKDANIYVVDRDNMGKFSPTADLNYQLPAVLGGGVFSSPAYFNGTLYYGASGDTIRAYSFSQARLSASPTSQSAHSFTYPGATPSISANIAGNGIVWVAENTSPAVLHAYNAGNLAVELYNSNMASGSRDQFGSGNKYITPTVANGKVYVGTTSGVGVFGILPGSAAPVVTSSATVSAVVGEPFRYQIAATNGPTSFGAATLPSGLVFNSASGVIAGIPSTAGTSNVTISAHNNAGTGSANLSISISNACSLTLSPPALSFSSGGGAGLISVTGAASCGWTATSNSSFVSITGGLSGSGSGTVSYSVAANTGTGRSGTLTVAGQTFTVTQSAGVISPASADPGTGSGTTQTFTFTFEDPNGYSDLAVLDVLINNYLDGIGACYVGFAPTGPSSGNLYLVDNAGDGGYVSGSPMFLPSSGSLGNSQCTINGSGSSVSASGNTLTLTLAVTFAPSFAGNKVFYTAARSNTQNSGWQALGTWNAPGPAPAGPAVGGMSPARSSTTGQTYTFTFTDTNGFGDLAVLDILTNSFLDGIGACYLGFAPTSASAGNLYLVDDAGDGGYASGSPMFLPSNGILQNSQCAISGAGSSVFASGNTLTLNLAITFNSGFAGNRVFYLAARNNAAGNSGWQAVGSVTVP